MTPWIFIFLFLAQIGIAQAEPVNSDPAKPAPVNAPVEQGAGAAPAGVPVDTTAAASPAKPPAAATPAAAAPVATTPPADPLAAAGSGPLEVTAQQSLEYHQDEHVYVARGAAKVTRGDVTIMADELRAYERIKADKKKEVYKFVAKGNVHITANGQHIYGDDAVYDTDKRLAALTGHDLRFVGQNATVTAKDALEYWPDKQQAIARGQATAVRDDRRVTADRLIAQFRSTAKGGLELEQLMAEDQVVITTKTDVARGERAIYDLVQNKARLSGQVRITRGASQLAGESADIDFATGISRVLTLGQDGRVRGLFVPDANTGASAMALPGGTAP